MHASALGDRCNWRHGREEFERVMLMRERGILLLYYKVEESRRQ